MSIRAWLLFFTSGGLWVLTIFFAYAGIWHLLPSTEAGQSFVTTLVLAAGITMLAALSREADDA